MNDEDLARLARGLGRRAADALNIERASRGVVARLRTAPPRRTGTGWLRAAAAFALVAGGGWIAYRAAAPGAPGVALAAAPWPGPTLTEDELEHILDSLAAEGPAYAHVASGLAMLDEGQLETLLREMEG